MYFSVNTSYKYVMKLIDGFRINRGTLCISSVLRDVSNYMLKESFGEEMYYGLGCGLFFGYTESDKVTGVGGFCDLMIENFTSIMTLTRVEKYVADEDAFEQIAFSIDRNIPVIVSGLHFHTGKDLENDQLAVDMMNLPMNYHYTIIEGYDKETRDIFMSDNTNSGVVSYETFLKLRDPKKKFIYLLYPKYIENIKARIYSSICKTTDYWFRMPENPKEIADEYTTEYLHISKVYNTLQGLERFRKSFLRGDILEDFESFQKTIFFIQTIAYRGTGGDMTRGLYSRYLRESAKITSDEKMLIASRDYAAAAVKWRKFFKTFNASAKSLFDDFHMNKKAFTYYEMINEIYDSEMYAISSLNRIIGNME